MNSTLHKDDKRALRRLRRRKRLGTLDENERPYLKWLENGGKKIYDPIYDKCHAQVQIAQKRMHLDDIAEACGYSRGTIDRVYCKRYLDIAEDTVRDVYEKLREINKQQEKR